MARKPSQKPLANRLNRQVVVPEFPWNTFSERTDEAIRSWWSDIFAFYDIDPKSSDRWERVAWQLALAAFPRFKIITNPAKSGRGSSRAGLLQLLAAYDAYTPGSPRKKIEQFWYDRKGECIAVGITGGEAETEHSLRDAIRRARKLRKQDEQDERSRQILIRYGIQLAIAGADLSPLSPTILQQK
jgi:hypothetical protein